MILLLLLIPLLLWGTPSWADPSVTVGTSYTGSPGSDPDTGSYTIGAGSNRVLLLAIAARDSADTVADPSSVTYAGNAMTQLVTTSAFGGSTLQVWIYYQTNPTSGSNTWSVDWPDANNQITIIPMTVIDAFQGGSPASNTNSATGTGSSTVTCTTASGELLIDMSMHNDGGHTITVGANQTQLSNDSVGGGNTLTGTSWQAGADGGVMSWTLSAGTDSYGTVCASIKPASAGGTTPFNRMLLGVGK